MWARQAMLDALVDDFLNVTVQGAGGFMKGIALNGLDGFASKSDAELVKVCRDADMDWILESLGITD
jgi:hypothetical protein